MAEGYSDTTVYDCQVKTCKQFFQDELPNAEFNQVAGEDRPDNMIQFKGPVFDITGFDARQVVAVLSDIVNNKCPLDFEWKNGKDFYLWIQSSSEDKLFRIKANPTKYQPGNGTLYLRPKGNTKFTKQAKKYDELNGALKAHYETDTPSFAKHIKQLLKNNAQSEVVPHETFEAYMILLFEIARRLVKSEEPSDKKEELDVLPIGSAIARIIKLLELGDEEVCIFKAVFLPGERFHCFTGKPEERREAIENINHYMAMSPIFRRKIETENHHLKDLQELFCYSDTVLQCQVNACRIFFQEQLPCLKLYPTLHNGVAVYDISDLDAQQVVSFVSDILNNRCPLNASTSEEILQAGFEEIFNFRTRPPRPYQPGKVIVFLRPKETKWFNRSPNSYKELNDNLKAFYNRYDKHGKFNFSDTPSFAMHIQQLFKNNAQIFDFPQATIEAYIILLLEIAEKTKDVLPIGSAIARVIKLLELGECQFEDVFLPGGKFHCFSDEPDVWEKSMKEINEAILTKKMNAAARVSWKTITEKRETTTKQHLNELQKMFLSKERLAQMTKKTKILQIQ